MDLILQIELSQLGTKRHHLLTDGQGVALCVVVVTAANTHDMQAAMNTLDNIVVKRACSGMYKNEQNLSLSR